MHWSWLDLNFPWIGLVAAVGLLVLLLLWQALLWKRHWLAAQEPALQAPLAALCAPVGCDVSWPQAPDALLIESSSFTRDPDNFYTVQVRIKRPATPDAVWEASLRDQLARSIAAAEAAGAELFVNDHAQLAAELGARAIHLGQEDLQALGDEGRARLVASGLALGVSSHSVWELCRARALPLRYIACGPVWPTTTKDMPWRPQGLDNLAWWCRWAGAPVVAIGGILSPGQAADCIRAGADGVCVVRGLGENPQAVVPAFVAAVAVGRAAARRDAAATAWPHPSLPAA